MTMLTWGMGRWSVTQKPQLILRLYIFVAAGYVGSKSFLEELLQVVHELRKANPNLVFGMHLMCLLLLSSV